MSGFELMAVVGCVAAVISAYHDGSSMLNKMLKKRREKKEKALQANADSEDEDAEDLESSLTTGYRLVQKKYDYGYRKVGDAFARGDTIATSQLKDIIIHLQGQIIFNLGKAVQEDSWVDLQELHIVSETSQIKAMTCLMDLHARLLVAVPINNLLHPAFAHAPAGFVEADGVLESSRHAGRTHNGLPGIPVERPPRKPLSPLSSSPGTAGSRIKTLPERPRRSSQESEKNTMGKLRDRFRFVRGTADGTATGGSTPPENQADCLPSSQPQNRAANKYRDRLESFDTAGSSTINQIPEDELLENHWAEATPSPTPMPGMAIPLRSPRDSMFTGIPSAFSKSPSKAVDDPFRGREPVNPPARASTSTSKSGIWPLGRIRTTSSASSGSSPPQVQPFPPPTNPRSMILPSENNNYRGLCKSAYYYQISSPSKKPIKIARKPVPGALAQTIPYFVCTECRFEGPLVRDMRTNTDVVDPAVVTIRATSFAIRYRWAYLFRSHMCTKDSKKPRFGCVLCSHSEARYKQNVIQPLTVYEGVDKLMSHVASCHTGTNKWPGTRDSDEEIFERLKAWINVDLGNGDGAGVRQGWDLWIGVE